MSKRIAFLFPGQGAQYVGMGKDFSKEFSLARQTFEEANDRLGRNLQKIIFEGPEELLTETANSQVAIYVMSMAILRVLTQLAPQLRPTYTAGFSLGEYSALTAAGYLSFEAGLALVQQRGEAMNEACMTNPGTMAVVLGLSAEEVEQHVRDLRLPNMLWAANFNCPEQVVLAGTLQGIEIGSKALLDKGAKRILPLKVHGAFHSGLMQTAADSLQEAIYATPFSQSKIPLVQNSSAKLTTDLDEIKRQLAKHVISPVRWEQSIRTLDQTGVDLYLEIGCGKVLAGFNKRIGTVSPTYSIEKTTDLNILEELAKYGM